MYGVPFGHASKLLNRTKRRSLNGGGGGGGGGV